MDDDTHDYSTFVEGEDHNGKPLTRLVWGRLVRVGSTHSSESKTDGAQKGVQDPNVVDIMENEIVFGRNKDCNAVFTDKKVSSKHCKVFRANNKGEVCGDIEDYKVFIDDLSSNGTWLNLKKIGKNTPTPLVHGDEISLIAPNNNSTASISYIFQDMREIEKRNAATKKLEKEEKDELTQPDDDHLMEMSTPTPQPTVKSPNTPPFIRKKSSSSFSTPATNNTNTTATSPPSSSPKPNTINTTTTSNSPTLVKSPTKILSDSTTTPPKITRTTSKEYLTPSPNKKDTNEINNKKSDEDNSKTKTDINNNNNKNDNSTTTSTTTTITRNDSDLKRKSSDLDSTTSTTSTTTTTTTVSTSSSDKSNKRSKMEDLEDNLLCGICQEILYKAVSLVPCLHNFCMCCYGDWAERSNDCPQCRQKVKSMHKNHAINNLVDSYLLVNPDKTREREELDEMDKRCKITEEMLLSGKSKVKKKVDYDEEEESDEYYSDEEDEEDEEESTPYRPLTTFAPFTSAPFGFGLGFGGGFLGGYRPNCRQCNVAGPDGFKCPAVNPIHVICSSCNLPVPDRKNDTQKIRCDLCNKVFCDLYWGCTVNAGNFKQLKDFQLFALPVGAIFGNAQETQYLNDILRANSKTVDNMFHEILTMLDDGTQTFRGIPTGINVKSTNYSCINCANIVLRDMAYAYRTTFTRNQLPKEVTDRYCIILHLFSPFEQLQQLINILGIKFIVDTPALEDFLSHLSKLLLFLFVLKHVILVVVKLGRGCVVG
eukprot:TRINITY_DN5928_c1_g1_i1.p1 TRINITY_DN5928_c1_g1~~TRINITY_DN5928_c1_g1_i1.p1  ORF type:complete len:765 (-),score=184.83 TRINITY_DN5928_c1_g1_i1:534-2828(-)